MPADGLNEVSRTPILIADPLCSGWLSSERMKSHLDRIALHYDHERWKDDAR